MYDTILNIDFDVFEFLYNFLRPGEAASKLRSYINHFFMVANVLGEFFILVPLIAVVWFSTRKRSVFWFRLTFMISALLISTLIFAIPKNLVKRDRPYKEYIKKDGKLPSWFNEFLHIQTDINEPERGIVKLRGFPSGHTNFAFALAGIIIVIYGFKTGIFFLFWAFLTGIGRIYGGLHFPSDVLGGIATGLLGVYCTVLLFRLISVYWTKFRTMLMSLSINSDKSMSESVNNSKTP